MNKVYVRFGDIHKNDTNISVFEAIAEDNVIRIIMPTFLYSTCQMIARNIDEPAFLVVGDIVGTGKDGEPLMSNCKIKIPLKYNKSLETFTCEEYIPRQREHKTNSNLPKWYK